jgi:hypothetical protein
VGKTICGSWITSKKPLQKMNKGWRWRCVDYQLENLYRDHKGEEWLLGGFRGAGNVVLLFNFYVRMLWFVISCYLVAILINTRSFMAQRFKILFSATPPYHLYVEVYQFLVSKKWDPYLYKSWKLIIHILNARRHDEKELSMVFYCPWAWKGSLLFSVLTHDTYRPLPYPVPT